MVNDEIEKLKEKIEKSESFEEKALAKKSLAEAYEEEEKFSEAIKIYKELLDQRNLPFPRTKVLLALGSAYDSLEQYEEALKWHKEVLADSQIDQDRLSVAEAAIAIGGIEYDKKNDIDEGLRYFKIAENEMRSSKDLLDKETQSYLLGRIGVAYYDRKEYTKGIEYITQAIELERQLGQANDWLYGSYHVLGQCHYYLNDYKKAIEAFEKILKEYKEYKYILEVYRYLANCYWGIGDYRNSAKYLELVFQMGPEEEDIPELEYLLGTSYHHVRLYDQAKAHLQRFLKLETEDKEKIEHAKRILAGKEWK